MKSETEEVKIRFTSEMLGTVPKDPDVYKAYIQDKAAEQYPENKDIQDEVNNVDRVEEKGWTGFHRDENGLFIYDYMIKGFIKAATETLMENGAVKKIPAYKKWIDRMVFIFPRKIYFGKMEADRVIERPIRVMIAQGPRVSLIRSDAVDAGTEITFTVEILNNSKGVNKNLVKEALEYGRYVGLGQWRGSGGYGQFEVLA